MNFNLQNRVALVTGASSGLGNHFARVLAKAGCTVGIAARRRHKLEALAAEIERDGGRACVLEMDVTDKNSVEDGVQELCRTTGQISILVNNAGSAAPANFIDADDNDTEQTFLLNQTAVWQVAQIVCRQMSASGQSGSVINIASVAGLAPVAGIASYAVSKAAVVQMTKVMALELARHGIRVNAIAPGYFDTDINHDFLNSEAGLKLKRRVPMRRFGELQDLDGVLLLLASDSSSFMTGTVIPVDGGHLVTGL